MRFEGTGELRSIFQLADIIAEQGRAGGHRGPIITAIMLMTFASLKQKVRAAFFAAQAAASLHRSQIPIEPVAVGAMQALAAERSGYAGQFRCFLARNEHVADELWGPYPGFTPRPFN